MGEQGDEAGVVALVVDDEAGVDGVALTVEVDLDRVGVPAWPSVDLVQGDLVAGVQQVGADEARHPTAHDRNFHQVGVYLALKEETTSEVVATERHLNPNPNDGTRT